MARQRNAPEDVRLSTLQSAAEYMKIKNVKTIRRYIAAGKLTGYRLGPRMLRVDLNEVDGLLRKLNTGGQR